MMVFDIPVNIHGVGGGRRFISATGKFFIRIEIPPHKAPRCPSEPRLRVGLRENDYKTLVRMVSRHENRNSHI